MPDDSRLPLYQVNTIKIARIIIMKHYIRKQGNSRILCLLLALLIMCGAGYALPSLSLSASAAGTPTSLGLAEHGIMAYEDGWQYQMGGKGQTGSGGKRVSDCAGLLYSYFSDLKAIGNCMGGATSQVNSNCVFSNDISEGIPRIHGLALTMPDYNEPESGIYGHIGIYIGNNYAADNSDYQYNMRREPVVGSGRGWTAWHVFDNGMKYPSNGWYAMDGAMYHYTDSQYDVDTVVDGYTLGSDGIAVDAAGNPVAIDSSILSTDYVSASTVSERLREAGYSGKDSTYDLIYGDGNGGGDDLTFNGKVLGNGVRVRSQPSTSSSIVTTLSRNNNVQIVEEVDGENLTLNGQTSSSWYAIITVSGKNGYIWAPYVERTHIPGALSAPTITAKDGYVTMTASDAEDDIYYTTDGSVPDEYSTPYTGPIYMAGYTFKAIAYRNGMRSGVTTATVLSNSSIFTDLTTDDWFFSAVNDAVYYGMFNGNGDGTFSPKRSITRGQFVTALANMDGVDLTQYNGSSTFTDLKKGKYYYSAILWASSMEIVNGFEDNTFRPDTPINREQMCNILAKYAGLVSSGSYDKFADDSKISGWAKNAVYACLELGIVNGVGNSKFDPKGTATRAQACKVLVNYYTL